MRSYVLLIAGLTVSTLSSADVSRSLPQPDMRPLIERPMPSMAAPISAPRIRIAPTSARIAPARGGKGDSNAYLHVAPNSVQGGVRTSHYLLGK
jgi:hypothetical protein